MVIILLKNIHQVIRKNQKYNLFIIHGYRVIKSAVQVIRVHGSKWEIKNHAWKLDPPVVWPAPPILPSFRKEGRRVGNLALRNGNKRAE